MLTYAGVWGAAAAAGGRGARARRSSKLGDKEGAGDADAAVLEVAEDLIH